MTIKKSIEINVFGRVQGVGFRYFTWQQANDIGLTGTVRNLHDGSVLIIAQGNEVQLQALRNWLLQGGPRSARIERFIERPYESDQIFNTFKVS